LAQTATTLFFLDARGKFFEDDVQEANIALGYRQMMPSGWNLGLWGGWDIRETTNDNTFNQISFGIEALSERFDFRANGYVPLEDDETVTNTNTFQALLQGNNILVEGTNTLVRELALYGFDAEAGILLFSGNRGGGGLKGAPAPSRNHELRAYAGGFWFDNDDARDAIAGPKGRLEYRINDVIASLPGSRLTIESEVSYDDVRDTKFEIGARLRIPFGGRGSDASIRTASLSAQELRMTDGLERDTDIVTDEQTDTTVTTEGAIDDATDVELNSVNIVGTTGQLQRAVADGGNRLIIVQNRGKRLDVSATDGQTLNKNQTVQGGASTIQIRGKKTGQVVDFTAPGRRPTLFSNDGNGNTGVVTVRNNTHVAGLNIRGVGSAGNFVGGNHSVRGNDNLDNVVVEQTDIQKVGQNGIVFNDNNSNIRITHTSISNTGLHGIDFGDLNSNISIWNTDITKAGSNGIRFNNENTNLDLWNLNIRNTQGAEGIQFTTANSNITLRDIEIFNSLQEGIFFANDNRNVTGHNININRTIQNTEGIQIGSNSRNFTFDGLTITDVQSNGIQFGGNNKNFTFLNTVITNAGSDGIQGGNNNENITIQNVTITNPDNEGIDLGSDSTNVLIADTTITGGAQQMIDGIELTSRNTVTIRNVTIDGRGPANSSNEGIEMSADNNVTITNVTIRDVGGDGLEVTSGGNTISMNNTSFLGTFGDDVIDLQGTNAQTLSGTDNVFNGTFGDVFCESNAQNGTFGFPGGPSNCPP